MNTDITSSELFKLMVSDFSVYPENISAVPEQIIQKGFFPACTGTNDGSIELKNKKIFIVGQDFGKEQDYEKAKQSGEDFEKVPTWKVLLKFLKTCKIDYNDCFYTNLLMGIRKGTKNTGPSPGLKDAAYIENCIRFFNTQVKIMEPQLIIFLGKVPYCLMNSKMDLKGINGFTFIQRIAEINFSNPSIEIEKKKYACVYLLHPSNRRLNLAKSNWSEKEEIEVVTKRLNLKPKID